MSASISSEVLAPVFTRWRPVGDRASGGAPQDDRHVGVPMRVAVLDLAGEEHDAVVEHGAGRLLDGIERLQQVGELGYLRRVDDLQRWRRAARD